MKKMYPRKVQDESVQHEKIAIKQCSLKISYAESYECTMEDCHRRVQQVYSKRKGLHEMSAIKEGRVKRKNSAMCGAVKTAAKKDTMRRYGKENRYNMKSAQHEKRCNTKRMQHKKKYNVKRVQMWCNVKRVQRKNGATWKEQKKIKMKTLHYEEKSETQKQYNLKEVKH